MPYVTRVPKYERGELPVEFTPLRYEELIVGEEMGPIIYYIKPSTHQKHCELFGHHHPWFEKEQVLFPWELWSTIRTISRWKYGRINAAVEAEYHYWFLKPARVGQPLSGSVIILDKYIKRGKKYYSLQGFTRDETGDLVFTGRQEDVFLGDREGSIPYSTITKEREKETGWWNDTQQGQVQSAAKDLPEGFILPCVLRPPIPFRVSGWEAGGWSKDRWKTNIHEDEFAQSKGYRGGLVEAPIVGEHALLDMLIDFFGPERFYTGGRWDMKHCGPVYMGDKLVSKARIAEKIPQNGSVRIVLDVRVENDDGSLVQVGTASAVIH